MTFLPEPPDGTRIEFESGTDLHAAHRDDASSRRAGWRSGDAGEVWCLYGSSVPVTWAQLVADYGEEALRHAVRLTPVAEDLPKREKWPTEVYARTGEWPEVTW
jgi:hypothetical protein